jgi:hypothetical protein
MTDKAIQILRDELSGWPIGSGYYQSTVAGDEAREMAEAVLDALRAAGIVLVELQSVDGLRFLHEDGTPYTPAELRHFAGEALAAAVTQ